MFDAEREEPGSAGRPPMKVYLINLDRHPDRLAHMRKQLDAIAFERIAAVDGSSQPPTAKGLTRFELACLESHKVAWRRFLAGPEAYACFLEDDLHVWPGLAELTGREAWIPADAHSIKIDTYLQAVELGERSAAIGGRELARLHSRHQSSAAYILSREGAARYLELTAGAPCPRTIRCSPITPAAPACASISSFPPSRSRITCSRPMRAAKPSPPEWPARAGTGRRAAPRRSRNSGVKPPASRSTPPACLNGRIRKPFCASGRRPSKSAEL